MGLLTWLKDYKYYNKPDGQAPIEKVIAITKYGFAFSVFCGAAECSLNQAIKTPLQVLNCMGFYVVPITSICATYSAVTFAATKIRDKDGPLNHTLGAFAAAIVLNKFVNQPMVCLHWGMLGGVIVAALKHSRMHGYEAWHTTPPITFNHGLFSGYDGTWTKDVRPWKN